MAITTLAGPSVIFLSEGPSDIIRLDDNHALAITGRRASVIDITSGLISIGGSTIYDNVPVHNPKGRLYDSSAYKVAIAYGHPSPFIKAAILDCDLSTDTFTAGFAELRNAFTDNPLQAAANFGAICASGNQIQIFWTEFIGGGGSDPIEYYTMTVDVSGATPVAGSAVKYIDTIVDDQYGGPVEAILMGSSGILLYNLPYYSTFSFGGSPSTPQPITGLSGVALDSVVLPGAVAFATVPDVPFTTGAESYGLWCTPTLPVKVSPPNLIPNAWVDKLQSRTVLTSNGRSVERAVIDGGTLQSVDNNYEYCVGCEEAEGGMVATMKSDNSQAIVITGVSATAVYLLGDLPTSDPFPDTSSTKRLWIYKFDGSEWTSRGVKT